METKRGEGAKPGLQHISNVINKELVNCTTQ